MSRSVKAAVGALIALLAATLLPSAAGADELDSVACSRLNSGIMVGQGAVVAVGAGSNCGNALESGFVTRILGNGEPDPDFGEGGVAVPRSNEGRFNGLETVARAGDKFLVAGDAYSSRLNPDGSLDTTYGENGFVNLPALSSEESRSADFESGQLVVAGLDFGTPPSGPATLVIRRYDENGQPVNSFGTNGVAEYPADGLLPVKGYLDGLSLSPAGKVALVLTAYDDEPDDATFALLRFDQTGSIDGGFGTNGVVDLNSTLPCASCRYTFGGNVRVTFNDDGSIRVLANRTLISESFDSRGLAVTVSEDGTALTDQVAVDAPDYPMVELPGGDLVGTTYIPPEVKPGFMNSANISRAMSSGAGGFAGGVVTKSFKPAPERVFATDILYNEATDTLFAIGQALGVVCAEFCESRARSIVINIRADTGEINKEYGTNGVAMLSATCPLGNAGGKSGTAWPRCALPQVKVSGYARAKGVSGRKPSMLAYALLNEFKSAPYGTSFRATMVLPKSLKLTRKARKKIVVSATGWDITNRNRPTIKVQTKGRTVKLTYRALGGEAWPSDYNALIGDRLLFKIRFKKGSLERVSRIGKQRIKLAGSLNPYSASRWYGPTSGSSTVRIRRG